MPHVRKISRNPDSGKNYYLVDANFLANRFIAPKFAPDDSQKDRIAKCNEWWKKIEKQLQQGKARVYVPDVCIAETFKVLAKKYYKEKWFKKHGELKDARNRLSKFVSVLPETLKATKRKIDVHDVSTTRDLIISVDRFYELFHKHRNNVSLIDLIVVATAKYLFDFFDIPKERLHIVTLDKALWRGSKKIQELPNAYDPTQKSDHAARVFEG